MIDREKMRNFDLGRLTLVGWLIGLFSVAGGMAIGIYIGFALKAEFQGPDGRSPKWILTLGGVLGFATIVLLFKLLQFLLEKAGLTVVRPQTPLPMEAPVQNQASGLVNSGAKETVQVAATEPEGPTFALNRAAQVFIGLVLLSLGGVLALLSQLPDMPRNPLVAQGLAALASLMGLASIFTWGRPYTLRGAFGLFSLMMFWMMIGCFFDAKPDFKAGVFAAFIGLASGAYAVLGKIPIRRT